MLLSFIHFILFLKIQVSTHRLKRANLPFRDTMVWIWIVALWIKLLIIAGKKFSQISRTIGESKQDFFHCLCPQFSDLKYRTGNTKYPSSIPDWHQTSVNNFFSPYYYNNLIIACWVCNHSKWNHWLKREEIIFSGGGKANFFFFF